MNIKIKRIDKSLPLPEYKTSGAAAFDLYAREVVIIKPQTITYIPLNVVIEIPKDYCLILAPRSSTHKKGLMMINSIGIVDNDFCGDEDELKSAYYNFKKDEDIKIEKGDRIAQALIIKKETALWNEVDSMDSKSRGGFGTTGLK
ncbi:MAG: dUTP diphosphatase [Candidatus Liptonbacteria bacterium CG11_big_fil_rev_8_21_14_0_20_35_14]|uniref:dUTP diphosphatase n=1 Tax=Candidatus Liptonbacteria bacterium CG11_big_fil_rev_8_21_14_0_20_35_14 TaxID=1974634 RepID=A0A2H0N828_9BACT|nr:MAG: dUTP diphosphatase [Candidatus Liptonbacteria bacterium CG11_big_fil_rev_8_21_14_0_20_35_14]